MEKSTSKIQSIANKNPLNLNNANELIKINSGKIKEENPNSANNNQNLDNILHKNIKNNILTNNENKEKISNNNYLANSLNSLNKLKDNNNTNASIATEKDKKIYLPFTREKRISFKSNINNLKSKLQTPKSIFKKTYNLEDIYKASSGKNISRPSLNNNNIKSLINSLPTDEISKNLDNDYNKSNTDRQNVVQFNRLNITSNYLMSQKDLSITNNQIGQKNLSNQTDIKNSNASLLKEQLSQQRVKHRKIKNKEMKENSIKYNDYNFIHGKTEQKPKKSMIRNYDEKVMNEKLYNIESKNILKDSNSKYNLKQINNIQSSKININRDNPRKLSLPVSFKDHTRLSNILNSPIVNHYKKIEDNKENNNLDTNNIINKFPISSSLKNNYSNNSFNNKLNKFKNNLSSENNINKKVATLNSNNNNSITSKNSFNILISLFINQYFKYKRLILIILIINVLI